MTRRRGEFVDSDLAPHVTATVHPSSILRSETDDERQPALADFVDDLEKVKRVLNGG